MGAQPGVFSCTGLGGWACARPGVATGLHGGSLSGPEAHPCIYSTRFHLAHAKDEAPNRGKFEVSVRRSERVLHELRGYIDGALGGVYDTA